MTNDLKARLDAMVRRLDELFVAKAEEMQAQGLDPLMSEIRMYADCDLLSKLDAAEAKVKAQVAERDEIGEALIRTQEGVPTAEDHALYVMALMRRKAARAELKLGGEK